MKGGGNIIESRMTRLGQEFAMLLLVSGNWATQNKLTTSLDKLASDADLSISLRPTEDSADDDLRVPYAIDVICVDQQGIVFEISKFLASHDIDIAEVNTKSYRAAHTGASMFAVQMHVGVPTSLAVSQLREEFMELCDTLNLDAIIEPVKP